MTTIIKIFDDKEYLNNVLPPLTLDIRHVVFLYHHKQNKRHLKSTVDVLKRYGEFKVDFIELKNDEKEISDLLEKHQEFVVDISANRYLTMLLFEKALRYKQPIIYYDSEENVIKDYRKHQIIAKDIFKLSITDLIELSGGEITMHMHAEPSADDLKTNSIIKKVMQEALNNYAGFITYIQKVNHLLGSGKENDLSYYLDQNKIERIVNDPQYRILAKYNLFKIEGRRLSFLNKTIRSLFQVSGSWLESYLYIILKESGHYDEVMMSVIIDFSQSNNNEYPITCEVDGIVLKDNHLLFISSKSNKVETDALNEIKTHQERFGNNLSHPIICTLEDLSDKNPSIFLKAQGLKIAVIEKQHFQNNQVIMLLDKIINNSYVYLNRL